MNSPPTTLGQYQIIREIARSNDIVYEAYDPLMNRRVAVKELAMPSGATSQQQDERISRFRREAQAAGTLNHPNIMTVFTFAEDAGRTFMAMEFLDGCSLRNELDTKGSLPVNRAIEIAIEVLHGLEHAHAKGVIHRDIKPDNVQILANNSIKITDFGIARLTFQPNLTMDGQVFGTPSYMSPEQVVGKEIDARSDLFSLGVMLYEMVSGQKPFAGDSVVSITYAIMNKEPQQPQGIDWNLWSVIAKALEKTPTARYGSATEMAKALENVLHPTSPLMDSYPANAYGSPTMGAPPVVPGAFGGSPVLNQPYNPYQPGGAPPAPTQGGVSQGGVYTQPYVPGGASVPSAPGGFGLNPYQAQPAYLPPGGAPQPFPVYYPPPPRAPILKPDQIVFLKRLSIAMLLGLTLIAILIVGLSSVAALQDDQAKRDNDKQIDSIYTNVDPQKSDAQNISNLEHGLDLARSEQTRSEIGAKLSDLKQKVGQDYADKGDSTHAEALYRGALEDNPQDAQNAARLGRYYYDSGLKESDPTEQQKLFKNAAEELKQAVVKETSRDRAAKDNEDAARANYMYASVTADVGEKRNALITASDEAHDPDLKAKIDTLLAQYR